MRILGIDPGYAILGYGVIEHRGSRNALIECGVLTTEAGEEMPLRLKRIYSGIMEIISILRPDVAAVEELFFNSNAKTAIKVGEARGAAILACANSGLPVYEYTPLQIKQALAGYGRASKTQIQQIVKSLLNLPEVPKPDDAADAVAAAICHGNSASYIDRVADAVSKQQRKNK
ncbi:MAG: crossover junction endodeoxyribonuclease RuvC [Clostridiales Family XIII bacterium]|jgi:crossover junction endodeoxyribonuclease RuvC|nr:crossover junction endodeoxyribonuclease RuvC [Clostridiales Family XIII bacterium]